MKKIKTINGKKKKEDISIIMVLFAYIELAESLIYPFKVLHEKLLFIGKEEEVCFVDINNYSLDETKINRGLVLSVPDLDQKLDSLIQTSENIVKNIYDKFKTDALYEIISKTYFECKKILQ